MTVADHVGVAGQLAAGITDGPGGYTGLVRLT